VCNTRGRFEQSAQIFVQRGDYFEDRLDKRILQKRDLKKMGMME